ncbi:hypothetical protein VDR83_21365 [Xanthomonas campestris pv. campestris]|nr:hypothetical protein [Xanthomonas campestris pv. campestris]
MNSTAKKFLLVIVWGGVLLLAAWRGSKVPFSSQWPLFEALRTTAAIIFAVVGAWLAIVYPERLKRTRQDNGEVVGVRSGPDRVKFLLHPIWHSTIILAVVLAVGMIAPLLRQFGLVQAHAEELRGVSYVVLASLTMLQICSVVMTLATASELKDQVGTEESLRDTTGAVFSRNRRKPKSAQQTGSESGK